MRNNLWSKTDLKEICYGLHIDLVHGHCTPLTKKLCLRKILTKKGLSGEYIYVLKKDFFLSDMILTPNLQTSYEVIAYTLIKGTM